MRETHLLDDGVGVGGVEGLLELVALGELALGDVHEHVRDLEDVIDVGLDAAPPFLHLVLVARDLPEHSASARPREDEGDGG